VVAKPGLTDVFSGTGLNASAIVSEYRIPNVSQRGGVVDSRSFFGYLNRWSLAIPYLLHQVVRQLPAIFPLGRLTARAHILLSKILV